MAQFIHAIGKNKSKGLIRAQKQSEPFITELHVLSSLWQTANLGRKIKTKGELDPGPKHI